MLDVLKKAQFYLLYSKVGENMKCSWIKILLKTHRKSIGSLRRNYSCTVHNMSNLNRGGLGYASRIQDPKNRKKSRRLFKKGRVG